MLNELSEKDGFCPPKVEGEIGICQFECDYDSECSGTKKCCEAGCGPGRCLEPVDFEPGN
jgi:hypothetical protein